MAELAGGDERFRHDRGQADPVVAAALAAYAACTGSEHAALTALADSRLLVPVVAVLADELAGPDAGHPAPDAGSAGGPGSAGGAGSAPGAGSAGGAPAGGGSAGPVRGAAGLLVQGEKASEMAMPSIVGSDGRRALPAFTSVAAVCRWQATARPVPLPAASVWQAAASESVAVIIDIAGPVPLVVEGARLAALAAGAQAPAMYQDPDAWQQVAVAAAEIAPGIRVKLSAPQDGLDFTLELAPPAGASRPVPAEVASAIGNAARAGLGGRVRAGIAVVIQPPS